MTPRAAAMAAIALPVPAYVTLPEGQIRLFRCGEGPDLVVLAGPLLAASETAVRLADSCPGWRVTAVEAPGIGGSSDHPVGTPGALAATLAAAIAAEGIGPCALVGLDLKGGIVGEVAARLDPRPALTLAIGLDRAEAWAAAGTAPPDLAPRTDGTHLAALWGFLRDRHVFEPADATQPARGGEDLPSAVALDATFVAAATRPAGFSACWAACMAALADPDLGPTVRVALLADLAAALAGLDLPAGTRSVPRTSPTPGLWHDEVATRRGRMHLRRAGGAGGRPLLILPTGGGSSAQFASVVTGLSGGRDVFTVDYLGNGLSEKPAREVSIEALAEDMAELVDAMGHATVDVWGSHTGAGVGLEFAVRYPEKVGRLVLEGPVFLAPGLQDDTLARYFPPLHPDGWGRHVQLAWNWRRDMFLFWPWYRVERSAARQLGLPSPQHLHDYAIGILESGPTYDGAYRAAFRYNTRARLPLLRRPALICAGPNDMLKDGLDEARALAVPGVTVRTTPTTVWWPDPHPQAAAETLAIYAAFLDGAPG